MNTTKGLVASLLFLIVSAFAFGQTETGQITGKVTDPTGAAVANAAVEIRRGHRAVTRYNANERLRRIHRPEFASGEYTVSANASGFAKR